MKKLLKPVYYFTREQITRLKTLRNKPDSFYRDRAIKWILENSHDGAGITLTHTQPLTYPEVTGYLIPTLLRWNMKDLALQYADWLVSIQASEGAWGGPGDLGEEPFVFDTGQILKGLVALLDERPDLLKPIEKACDWMLSQINDSGQIMVYEAKEEGHEWLDGSRRLPDAIHLYALEPLRAIGERLNRDRYTEAVDRVLGFYLADDELTCFSTLSHFHAYIIEALIDLGKGEAARKGMEEVAALQQPNGAVPAYRDVNWVCSTGMFQYAVIWYKLGEHERADRTFAYASSLQNRSGGFYGSYGWGAEYFYRREISWAVKYYLDALWYKDNIQE